MRGFPAENEELGRARIQTNEAGMSLGDNEESVSESPEKLRLLDQLAEDYLARYRRGERPDVQAYCSGHQEWSTEIRDFLSAVAALENARPDCELEGATRSGSAPEDPCRADAGRVADYRLLREVGRGGMGIVYEAEQESLRRRVALKVLPARVVRSTNQVQRFYREARAAAKLHHTNIVSVFGVGEDQGVHYYVMPFIDGLGLDRVLDELRRLPQWTPRVASARPVPSSPQEVSTRSRPQPREPISAADIANAIVRGGADEDPSGTIPVPVLRAECQATAVIPDGELGSGTVRESARVLPIAARPAEISASHGSSLSGSGWAYWRSVARIGMQVADALDYASGQGVLHRDIKPSNLLLDQQGNVWVTDFGLAKEAGGEELTAHGDILGTLRYLAPERLQGVSDLRGDIYGLGVTLYELLTLQRPFGNCSRSELVHRILHDELVRPRAVIPEIPRDLETIVLKATSREPRDRYPTAAAMCDDLRLFLEDRPIHARQVGLGERLWRWCRRNPLLASLETAVAVLGVAALVILTVSNARIRHEATARAAALQAKDRAGREREAALESARASELLARRRYYATQMSLAGIAVRENEWSRALDLLANQSPQTGQADLRGFDWHYLMREIHRGLQVSFRQQPGEVWSLAFSPDGRRLAVASGDPSGGAVRLWNTATGELIRSFDEGQRVPNGIGFSPDGRQLMAGFSDAAVRVWDVDTARLLRHLPTSAAVRSAEWSPDGRLVVAGCEDGTIHVWDTQQWQLNSSLKPHGGPVLGLVLSSDGRQLFTSAKWGSEGRLARQHDLAGDTPRTVRELPGLFVADATPQGKEIAVLKWATLRLWNLDAAKDTLAFTIGPGLVNAVRLSPEGSCFASAGRDDRMAVMWDLATQQRKVQGPHTSAVMTVAFDRTGKYWATGASDGEVKVWHREPPSEFTTLKLNSRIQRIAMAQDDGVLILGTDQTTEGRLVDSGESVTMSPIRQLQLVSADGKICVAVVKAPETASELIQVWDRPSRLLQYEFRLPGDAPLAYGGLAISRTGRLLATRAASGPIRIWDLAAQRPLPVHELTPNDCLDMEFSPDERLLAGACQFGRVRLWDVNSGQALEDLWGYESGLGWCQCVCFSADGKRLAAGNDVGIIRVWDLPSRNLLSTLNGHLGETNSLQFFPDGKTLAVAGIGPIRLWDVEIGQECLALPVPDYKTIQLALTADGQSLISLSDEGVVRLWRSGEKRCQVPFWQTR